jgi:hypothetical protein
MSKIERLKIWPRIYDSDRISGAADMGTPARAHGTGSPGV